MAILALTGKTAIVTGGAGGLGRSMVAAFADAGANVVVASRNLEKIEAVAEKICKKGHWVVFQDEFHRKSHNA